MLTRSDGATITQIVEATGWQPHTVRGAFAGALKKRLGLTVTSEKVEGRGRVYRIRASEASFGSAAPCPCRRVGGPRCHLGLPSRDGEQPSGSAPLRTTQSMFVGRQNSASDEGLSY